MNNNQLEDLYKSGTEAMRAANITPLPPATWDKARWDAAKAVISAKIVAGEADSHAIDNDLESFISRVEGTPRGFQCMVPIYNPQGKLVHCGHTIQRRDRILRHVRDNHLGYRPFVCEGRCGTLNCDYAAADQRYLLVHIDPDMVECKTCEQVFHRQNFKEHAEKCT